MGDPRVGILHAVEPLEGRVVRTEGELPAQEVIAEGEDGPPDCQAFLLHGAVPSLSLRELPTQVQHRPLLYPPHRAAFTLVRACWHSSVHWTGSGAFFSDQATRQLGALDKRRISTQHSPSCSRHKTGPSRPF